jgi:uncharacterized membrane protein YhaH (DUF805 family)
MRESNTDNLFYGELLLDRLVWIDITIRNSKEKDSREQGARSIQANKAILQITNWRFIITFLGNSLGDHKAYSDFSWGDIKELASSSDSLLIRLKDDSDMAIKQEEAHMASIRLWALGEGIKTETRNSDQGKGDVWEQSSSINFTCKTLVPHTGNWSLVLESYGIVCKEGEYPKRLNWNSKLTTDIVQIAFSKKISRQQAPEQHKHSKIKSNQLPNDTASNANIGLQARHQAAGNIIRSPENDTDSSCLNERVQPDSGNDHQERKILQRTSSQKSLSDTDSQRDPANSTQEPKRETRLTSALELLLSRGLDKGLIETLLNRGSIKIVQEGAELTSVVDLNILLDTTIGIQINFIKEDASHPFVIKLIMRGLIGTVPCSYWIRSSDSKEEEPSKFGPTTQGSSLQQQQGQILDINLIKQAVATCNYDLIKRYQHEFVTETLGPHQGKNEEVRFIIDRVNQDQPNKRPPDFIVLECQGNVYLIPNISPAGANPVGSIRRSLAYKWGSGKNFLDLIELAVVRKVGDYYVLSSEGRVAPVAEVQSSNKADRDRSRSLHRTKDKRLSFAERQFLRRNYGIDRRKRIIHGDEGVPQKALNNYSQLQITSDGQSNEKKHDCASINFNTNFQSSQERPVYRRLLVTSYIYFWKRSPDFSGVISRLDFWVAVASNGIALMIVAFILSLVAATSNAASIACAATLGIYLLIVATASLSLQARRVRDTGLSAWLLIALAIPYAGFALLIVYLLPTRRKNTYNKTRQARHYRLTNNGEKSIDANPPIELDELISDQSAIEIALKRLRDN